MRDTGVVDVSSKRALSLQRAQQNQERGVKIVIEGNAGRKCEMPRWGLREALKRLVKAVKQ